MPFSLYGDLPEPSSEKPDPAKKTSSTSAGGSGFSGLYASLPAPGGKGDPSSATTVASPDVAAAPVASDPPKPAPSDSSAPKPAGWSTFGHFRPVMRKPTIQAKPKLNRAVIPAGATVVSTTKVSKSVQEQETVIPPPAATAGSGVMMDTPLAPLSRRVDASYYSVNDDINGFRAAQQAKKKGKNKKQQQKQQQEPVMFDLNEDYDPHRPNDYELYKEDRKQHKEEMKRRQEEERRRQRRQRERSFSPYSSDSSRSRSRSRSGSISPSPSRSRSRSPRRAAFAPPPNLYARRSPSPPPPPRRFQRSPSPPQLHHKSELPVDLSESADDVYMRRMRMSSQRTTTIEQPNDRGPDDVDDDDMRPAFGLGAGPDMARKVMAKFGWQEGQGLGRDEDGIRGALKVQATGRGSGVILHSDTGVADASPQHSSLSPPQQPTPSRPQIPVSPVVLLTNMVGPGEVDDMLQQETAEECGKYGKVERCLIFEVPGGRIAEDQAVRIFVKFSAVESAVAAVNDLDGRYFGGRVVTAKHYDCARFDRLDLAPGPEEGVV